MKVGAAHCEALTCVRMPKDSNHLISIFLFACMLMELQTVWHKMVWRQG
jgi:hypothetical protein